MEVVGTYFQGEDEDYGTTTAVCSGNESAVTEISRPQNCVPKPFPMTGWGLDIYVFIIYMHAAWLSVNKINVL